MADFTSQRQAVRTADAALAQALYQKTVAPNAANQAALTSAQQTARANRDALNTALAASIWASADTAANLQGNLPIALFPVRLETRYVRAATAAGPVGVPSTGPAGTLQIRVYPDDILAQTHEPELTDDEWQAGRAYWTAGDTPASWSALLARFTVPRAAWIVSQTNTAVRPPARAASWTRQGTAVLPDNFAAFAFRGGALVSTIVGSPIPEPLTLTMSPVLDAAQRAAIAGSSLQIDSNLLWTIQFAAAESRGHGPGASGHPDRLGVGLRSPAHHRHQRNLLAGGGKSADSDAARRPPLHARARSGRTRYADIEPAGGTCRLPSARSRRRLELCD